MPTVNVLPIMVTSVRVSRLQSKCGWSCKLLNYPMQSNIKIYYLHKYTIFSVAGKKNYNLVQDAKLSRAGEELAAALGIDPGDPILTAAFSPSKTLTNEPIESSALCIYSIADIEAKFNENIHMCFNGSIKYRNMPYISGLILDGNCPEAGVSIDSVYTNNEMYKMSLLPSSTY